MPVMPVMPEMHFFVDVNGTVIFDDKVKGQSAIQGFVQAFSENCYFDWNGSGKTRSFRKYMDELKTVKGAEEKQDNKQSQPNIIEFLQTAIKQYKNKAENTELTQNEQATLAAYENFLKTFTSKVEKLTGSTQLDCFIKYDAENSEHLRIGNSLSGMFVSAKKFLLTEVSQGNAIIFRTFGTDGLRIKEILQSLPNNDSSTKIDYRAFQDNSEVTKHKVPIDSYLPKGHKDIYDAIVPGQWQIWMDNFSAWNATKPKKQAFTGGKPLYLDPNKQIVPMFFDDNACDKQILCVVVPGLMTSYLSTDEHMAMQQALQTYLVRLGWIVPVNTWEAATNENYFIQSRDNILTAAAANPNYVAQCYAEIEEIVLPYRKLALVSQEMSKAWALRGSLDVSRFFTQKPAVSETQPNVENLAPRS